MKPPTLAMIRLLREIERQPVTMASADRRTLTALATRCLVGIPAGERMPYSRARWTLTDAGRRVLAEHTTTGESQ